jgi:hypothetical protein
MKTKNEISARISATSPRSAWSRGVKTYALELLEGLEGDYTAEALLNGAENWRAFSYGGCALIYDADIAARLCNPSELKRKNGGCLPPNSSETWLDVQARALNQAARLIAKNSKWFPMKTMSLYHVSQSQNDAYETFSNFVICAPDEETAKLANPSTGEPMTPADWKHPFPSWCDAPEHVTARLIGTATESTMPGIICASFRAG